jgi:hypothetical protein
MLRPRRAVVPKIAVALALIALGAAHGAPSGASATSGPLPAEAALLPAESHFLMGLDVRRFVASPFYERFARPGAVARPSSLDDLARDVGLDPERDVDQLVLAGGVGETEKDFALLALGRFDRARIESFLKRGQARLEAQKAGAVTVYSMPQGPRPSALALLSERALLLGAPPIVEAAAGLGKPRPTLRTNLTLMGLVERVPAGSTFWMVGDDRLLAQMNAGKSALPLALPALRSLVAAADFGPGVTLNLVGETSDAKDAASLKGLLEGFLALVAVQGQREPALKDLATAVTVSAAATQVRVGARLTYEMIAALMPAPAHAAPEKPQPPARK